MAKVIEDPRPTAKERLNKTVDGVQGSQAWNSIFRPGSIFRKGYTDSPRNRSYVIMNSVLYHLHPVKVKRHAVKVSYTLCLGGLSFFLFILLSILISRSSCSIYSITSLYLYLLSASFASCYYIIIAISYFLCSFLYLCSSCAYLISSSSLLTVSSTAYLCTS